MKLRLAVPRHVEQVEPNSCVAACLCMMLDRSSAPFDQRAIHAGGASGNGHDLFGLARLHLDRHEELFLDDDPHPQLQTLVARGALVALTIVGPVYVRALGHAPAGAGSRHGPLCAPGAWGKPIHCLLVVGIEGGAYSCLDPYYPEVGQPFLVLAKDLRAMLGGAAVACFPSAAG